jgi:hypothetical protein
MTNDLFKNTLTGATLADTLVNINAVMMLLKSLNFNSDINESAEYGLFLIYTSIQDSLEYEIKKVAS